MVFALDGKYQLSIDERISWKNIDPCLAVLAAVCDGVTLGTLEELPSPGLVTLETRGPVSQGLRHLPSVMIFSELMERLPR